jgi:hypothetical protein
MQALKAAINVVVNSNIGNPYIPALNDAIDKRSPFQDGFIAREK